MILLTLSNTGYAGVGGRRRARRALRGAGHRVLARADLVRRAPLRRLAARRTRVRRSCVLALRDAAVSLRHDVLQAGRGRQRLAIARGHAAVKILLVTIPRVETSQAPPRL